MKAPVSKILLGMIFFAFGALPASAAVSLTGDVSTGYRVDRLSWTIAGTLSGNSPNVLSALDWQVESVLLHGDGQLSVPSEDGQSLVFLRFWGDYGQIFNGRARDSDYLENNRNREYSRVDCAADIGHLYDLAAAVGYEINWSIGDASLMKMAPFVGYEYNVQHLSLTHGQQRLSASPGPLAGVDSRYVAAWQGPLAGLQMAYQQGADITFWMEGACHRVDYTGEGRWNLRTDLKQDPSFRQTAEGFGWSFSGGGLYSFDASSALGVDLGYRRWTASENGIDTVYFAKGDTVKTRLNGVEWESWSISLRYQHRF